MFLVLGLTAALAVLLMDSIWGDGLPSLIGVVHFCAVFDVMDILGLSPEIVSPCSPSSFPPRAWPRLPMARKRWTTQAE